MKNKKVIYLLILFVVLIAHTVFLSMWLSSERIVPKRVRVEESKRPGFNSGMLLPTSNLTTDSTLDKNKFNYMILKEIR
jgi:flagellar basal body-associated protein FliL